jgi:hypothetical protein
MRHVRFQAFSGQIYDLLKFRLLVPLWPLCGEAVLSMRTVYLCMEVLHTNSFFTTVYDVVLGDVLLCKSPLGYNSLPLSIP